MADMNINIIQATQDENGNVQQPKESKKGDARLFNRVRTRKSKFSMSISGYFGEKLGDSLYDKVLKETGDKDKANSAKFAAAYTIGMAAQLARKTVQTAAASVGTFTSNQATQNTIDNFTSVTGEVIGAIGTIGSAAAAGGPWAAVAAAAAVTANKAIEIATASMNISKENAVYEAEANRNFNRLGYIETGYSR